MDRMDKLITILCFSKMCSNSVILVFLKRVSSYNQCRGLLVIVFKHMSTSILFSFPTFFK